MAAKLGDMTVALVLIAVGFFAAGAGLLQIPPTDTSTIVYSSGGGSSLYNAWPATTNWEPSKTTNLTGASFLLRLQTGKEARDVDITFLVTCSSKVKGAGAGRAYVTSTFAWYTVPTYDAAQGKVSGGFVKNEPCSMNIAISSPDYNIYEVFTPANGRKALAVWGYEAPATTTPPPPGPGPGGPSTTGTTVDVGDGDVEPEPPPEDVDVGAWIILGIVLLVVIVGVVWLFVVIFS